MTLRAASSFGAGLIVSRSRLHRRGRLRDLGPAPRPPRRLEPPAGRRAGAADRPRRARIRCGWRPACRSTATTWTRPSRPVEADLAFAISQAPPRGRRFPRRRAHRPANWPRGPRASASACGCWKARPAREGAEIADDGRRGRSARVTSGGFSPTPRPADRLGFVPPALRRSPARASRSSSAASAQAGEVVEPPFVPHRYVRKP